VRWAGRGSAGDGRVLGRQAGREMGARVVGFSAAMWKWEGKWKGDGRSRELKRGAPRAM
jgi:hypothetical protein